MKNLHDYTSDIATIRSAMERSVKFLSLSGLSGVLAGVYALTGAGITYYLVYYPHAPFGFPAHEANAQDILVKLVLIAAGVLVLSLGTAFIMSVHKARRLGVRLWNTPSKLLLTNLAIPLATGGAMLSILLWHGYGALVASTCLIFYGMALLMASPLTVSEIRYLGISEIVLGLAAALLPGYGLIFWAGGFGVLHIIYGLVVYYRYDREKPV